MSEDIYGNYSDVTSHMLGSWCVGESSSKQLIALVRVPSKNSTQIVRGYLSNGCGSSW